MEKNKKSVTKNYVYNMLYQILMILSPIITTPYLSRVLGAENIGVFSYTLSIATYFVMFGSVGISLYGQRTIAYFQDRKEKYSKIFYEILLLKAICMLISICIFYFSFVYLKNDYQIYYRILVFELIGNLLDISWFFQGMEDFKKIVPRNFLVKVISIICIFTFIKSSADLTLYYWIYTISLVVGNISLWFYLPKYLCKIKRKSLNIAKHLKPTLSLFIPQIAIQVYTVLDRTMIGLLTNNMVEVGIYEQSTKIIKILLTIITSLGTVMIPKISNLFANKNNEEIKIRLRKSFHFVWLIALPISFGLIGIANNFIPWFLGKEFLPAITVVQIGSLLFVAIGLNNVTGMQYLISVGRQREFTYSVIIGALINFCGNYFLIPSFGAIGAIVFSVIAELIILTAQMIMIKNDIKLKDLFNNFGKCIASSLIMFAIVFPLSLYFKPSIINTGIIAVIGVVVYFSLICILKDDLFLQTFDRMMRVVGVKHEKTKKDNKKIGS
jgi:O-antigen/teichoic acid export membrane protein